MKVNPLAPLASVKDAITLLRLMEDPTERASVQRVLEELQGEVDRFNKLVALKGKFEDADTLLSQAKADRVEAARKLEEAKREGERIVREARELAGTTDEAVEALREKENQLNKREEDQKRAHVKAEAKIKEREDKLAEQLRKLQIEKNELEELRSKLAEGEQQLTARREAFQQALEKAGA